jgi:LuxR family maltose regulon positive regulatory protein
VFLDEGEPMAQLLREAASAGVEPRVVGRLLGGWRTETHRERAAAGQAVLVEPLSHRELEVLALLAEGLNNAEIGQRLFIALPTVKSHTRNLYGKLGVHSRNEAVDRARALGILRG